MLAACAGPAKNPDADRIDGGDTSDDDDTSETDDSSPITDSSDTDDSASTDDTSETGETDADGDGQAVEEGDCNDDDPSVFRGAADTAGDGDDTSCDGLDSARAMLAETLASASLLGESTGSGGNDAGITLVITEDATGDGLPDVYTGAMTEWFDPERGLWPDPRVSLVSGVAAGAGALTDVSAASWVAPDVYSGFGGALDRAGDIDGDGLGDVLVGAGGTSDLASGGGIAAIYLGGVAGDQSWEAAHFTVRGTGAYDWVGALVDGNLDLNADGVMDAVVSTERDSAETAALVFYGPLSGDVTEEEYDVRIGGYPTAPVARRADVDIDGYDDLLLRGDTVRLSTGADGATLFEVIPPVGGNWSFSFGDINGDGATDLAYGVAGYDSAGPNSGRVGFFLGPLSGSRDFSEADAFLDAEHENVGLARGLSIAGDLDGDGDDEIAVGAPGVYAWHVGAVAIFSELWSGTVTTASADLVLDGPSLSDAFGWKLATDGDLDGDGRDDLVVGAPNDAGYAGSVWLFPASELVGAL